MVLAVAGGSDLLQRTQQVFFQKKQNQVSKVGGKKGEGRGGEREEGVEWERVEERVRGVCPYGAHAFCARHIHIQKSPDNVMSN